MRKSTNSIFTAVAKKEERFSEYFHLNIPQKRLPFVDVYVRDDIKLFFDPGKLLRFNDAFYVDLSNQIVSFFSKLLQAIRAGQEKDALQMLEKLCEPKETHLGYGERNFNGKAIGEVKGREIYNRLSRSRAVQTGILTDLEETALLVPGIDCDGVSDISIMILKKSLIKYTQQQCILFGIPMQNVTCKNVWDAGSGTFVTYTDMLPVCYDNPIILVPKNLTGQIPVMNSRDFYRHEILDDRQDELMTENGLFKVLKNGKRVCSVTKKELKASAEFRFSKQLINSRVERNPGMIKKYRERKKYLRDEE